MSITAILIIVAFIVIVALMIANKINAVVALPLMAIVLSLVAGVAPSVIVNDVIGGGVGTFASLIITALIASVLGEVIRQTGIAEKLIRSAAELGGDNPYLIALLSFLACGFCFIGLYGGGARIMIGLIIFPIMLAVGVPKTICSFVLLSASFLGYFFNVTRWNFIQGLFTIDGVSHVSQEMVQSVALMLFIPGVIIAIALIIIGIKVKGKVFCWAARNPNVTNETKKVPLIALFSPIVPLVLVLAFKWDINTALLTGILFAMLTTQFSVRFKGSLALLNKSIFDGFANIGVTIILIMGIGMVIEAAGLEELRTPITSILTSIVPDSRLGIILLFGLIGPFLCVYRGPFNPWGLGGALASILIFSNINPGILVAMFWLYDYFVGVNDPTASQVQWANGYLQLGSDRYSIATAPAGILFCLIGIIIAVIRFM